MGGIAAGGGIGALVIALVVMFLGGDPSVVLDQGAPSQPGAAPGQTTEAEDSMARFVEVVLADTEEVWAEIFPAQIGQPYQEPTLVLFSGSVQSECGFAQAAMGPFYCPLDQNVYIDLSFYRELQDRLGAPGDFAQAYVIAHEVGHHIQTLVGTSAAVRQQQQASSEVEANQLSVRMELQADCYAGVWANRAEEMFGILEAGDIREALGAASAVGDDRLQQASGRGVVPESFTHGSAEQRMRWFQQGWEAGDPRACDTFNAASI